jgi:S1-C subfamily serine protease
MGKGVAMSLLLNRFVFGNVLLAGLFGCAETVTAPPAASAAPAAAARTGVSCIPSEERLSPDRIDGTLRPNIVQIVSDNSLGSGFMLASGDPENVLIVTNYHVVAEGVNFNVVFVRKDGTRVNVANVEVVKTSPEHDLALLKAPRMTTFGPGLVLGDPPRAGQSVATLGYPVLAGPEEKVEPALSTGLVAAPRQTIGSRGFVQTDLQLVPGNSGGPAVNSCGAVIGVTAAHHAEHAFVGLLVPASDVQELRKKYEAPRRSTNQEVSQRVEDFLHSLQESEDRTAASYLSRGFLAQEVFPKFQNTAKSAIAKEQLLRQLLDAAKAEGLDVSQLTEEQLQEISSRFGLELTPDEAQAQLAIVDAQRKGSDAYALLQSFVAPYLDGYFGRVDRYKVVDIKPRDEKQVVYVAVDTGSQQKLFRFDLAYEWGDWQITDFSTREDAPADDRRQALEGVSNDWQVVNKKR